MGSLRLLLDHHRENMVSTVPATTIERVIGLIVHLEGLQ